ncbi:6-phospho-alpha-glucosidase [Niallia taxi]|uniref:6-phospho-alpha-glucosidase n=1 Tax=Niallia taxi TaxID=2499688 RepID=A0A3S2TR22_9BACI|nr:6-phospho-alpha-glucosidase [Niallia taxi]MCM3214099.1 6-phospho-alpha-glucosidase [Niallia taxi]MDK8640933.1 6-phospho-alpha-glucosidase [Niallia taxi]MED4040937.1 6-phospho-alpha-glucosidase [Niallia taxi]MED4052857.1 6-phospho-alpha-glucosidase [Niallia taxi]MED4120212.1 6-phospho-alpha-glucosidase [Niallia taxi]
MKKYILAVAGGGSTYTPGIIRSLMDRLEDLPLSEIRFYDIDGARQSKVVVAAKAVIAEYTDSILVTDTTDPQTAFENADFVFAQMRVGKYALRELDEKIPLSHNVVGQETCGPGGLAYGLRTIAPMIELIDYVEQYAKETAWIVNYSNPASIVAEGVRKLRPKARVLNICDMPVATMRNIAAILGVEREELVVDYFGLNHFGWFTRLEVDGIDRLAEVREHVYKHGLLTEDVSKIDYRHADSSWIKTFKNIKLIMDHFPEYLPNPYLQYYLFPDHIVETSNKDYTRANEVMDGREKTLFETVEKFEETGILEDSFAVGVHGTFIVDVTVSIAQNLGKRYVVMTENNGTIPNLPADAMIEVPAFITADGPKPEFVGDIPYFYKAMIEQQLASEKILVEAIIEGSYEKALQAFTLNKTLPSAKVAKAVLDDLIAANKDFWPTLNKEYTEGLLV